MFGFLVVLFLRHVRGAVFDIFGWAGLGLARLYVGLQTR